MRIDTHRRVRRRDTLDLEAAGLLEPLVAVLQRHIVALKLAIAESAVMLVRLLQTVRHVNKSVTKQMQALLPGDLLRVAVTAQRGKYSLHFFPWWNFAN